LNTSRPRKRTPWKKKNRTWQREEERGNFGKDKRKRDFSSFKKFHFLRWRRGRDEKKRNSSNNKSNDTQHRTTTRTTTQNTEQQHIT